MALHIFAYNLHLKVSHAVCNNHFNQVPLTVNIVSKRTKYLEFMRISIQKIWVPTVFFLKQSWEMWIYLFFFLASYVFWDISHKQVSKRSLKISTPALARVYMWKTLSKPLQYLPKLSPKFEHVQSATSALVSQDVQMWRLFLELQLGPTLNVNGS